MPEYKGIEYLRNKLNSKRSKVLMRYKYYEMKNQIKDLNMSMIPPSMRWLKPVLGWCSKAVDSIADRLVFDGFIGNDPFAMNEIFRMNNPDILTDAAILGALISSCNFIYISADEDKYPRLQNISGADATGTIDPITNMLIEGYAVLERDELNDPTMEAYFIKGKTDIYVKGKYADSYKSSAPYALLVPVIYRPDAVRPFGHSRISRACIEYTQQAGRTMRRSEVAAEFYSYPQKYVLGLSDNAEKMEQWRATMSALLDFRRDEEGNVPQVGQFQSASMQPYLDQLKSIASMFAGETGLTLEDLGFSTGNPPSYDAIRASHESLRMTARKAQRTFGSGFLNVGYLAACLRDNTSYNRAAFVNAKTLWQPIFVPDASALAGIGDAVYKINEAAPGYIGRETLRQMTGMEGDDEQ